MSFYSRESNNYEISLQRSRRRTEAVHIFSDNITRVWYFIRDISFVPIVNPSFLSQISITRGKDTWSVGSEFRGYWVRVCSFNGKCIKVTNEPQHKEIVFKYSLSIDVMLTQNIILHRITDDNTTLVILSFQLDTVDDMAYIPIAVSNEGYRPFFKKLLADFETFIKGSPLAQVNYESCIINKNRRFVFDFIIDLNNIAKVAPLFCKNFEYKGEKTKVGTFIKAISRYSNKTIYFTIKKVDNSKDLLDWNYSLETFGTNVGILKQNVEFDLFKINDNMTLLSVVHSFRELISKEEYDNFVRTKKESLKKIKRYCEENY